LFSTPAAIAVFFGSGPRCANPELGDDFGQRRYAPGATCGNLKFTYAAALHHPLGQPTSAWHFLATRLSQPLNGVPAMLGDNFWFCVEALAEAIDDNAIASNEALDQTETALRQLNRADRDEMRRHMLLIVTELDRVEVRMKQTDGLIEAVA
jgi:hypothetical protein